MNTPENEAPNNQQGWTEAPDAILVVIDGSGDTTIKPLRPNIPRDYPRPNLKPRSDSDKDKPAES